MVSTQRETNIDATGRRYLQLMDVSKWGLRWRIESSVAGVVSIHYTLKSGDEVVYSFYENICDTNIRTVDLVSYKISHLQTYIDHFVDIVKRRESIDVKLNKVLQPISYRYCVRQVDKDNNSINFDVAKLLEANPSLVAEPVVDPKGVILPNHYMCIAKDGNKKIGHFRFRPEYAAVVVFSDKDVETYSTMLMTMIMRSFDVVCVGTTDDSLQ